MPELTEVTVEMLKSKTHDELLAYNQKLMAARDAVMAEQLKVKAELNSRASLAKFNALTDTEKAAIVQHINAGGVKSAA